MVLAVLLFSDVILLVVVDDEVVLAVQPAVLEGLDGEPVGALVLVGGAHQEGAGVVHREGEKLLGLRAAYLAKIPAAKNLICQSGNRYFANAYSNFHFTYLVVEGSKRKQIVRRNRSFETTI